MARALSVTVLPPIEEVERLASSIDGWLSRSEGHLLYELAARADAQGCIVEIGSWKGRSTVWLASGARAGHGARVIAIDPHRDTALHTAGESTEQALRTNLDVAGVADRVDVVVATSQEAAVGWDRPISLLWIDGEHDYASVRRDLLLWQGHVVNGGVVALHDTVFWDGPREVVAEFLGRSRNYSELGYAGTITYAARTLEPSLAQRLRKRLARVSHYLYGVRVRAYADNRFRYADIQEGAARRARPVRRALRLTRGGRR